MGRGERGMTDRGVAGTDGARRDLLQDVGVPLTLYPAVAAVEVRPRMCCGRCEVPGLSARVSYVCTGCSRRYTGMLPPAHSMSCCACQYPRACPENTRKSLFNTPNTAVGVYRASHCSVRIIRMCAHVAGGPMSTHAPAGDISQAALARRRLRSVCGDHLRRQRRSPHGRS